MILSPLDSKTTLGPFDGQGGAQLVAEKSVVQSNGPFGGNGGNTWNDGVHAGVRQLIIAAGNIVDSIQIEYDDHVQSVWYPKHGGKGGENHTVKLNYPHEFLISISGYYEPYHRSTVIHSLTFHSNKRIYGPFGTQKGNRFLIPTTGHDKIVGFYGTCGRYLDSIGVYLKPIPLPHVHSVGPYGGQGENPWDDGVYTTVKQLIVVAGDIINSICIEYDKNGQSVWSPKHGKSNDGEKHMIKLEYPIEFLIAISGHYNEYYGMTLIRSLTFKTNKKTYGPIGEQTGSQFSISSNGGKIVGFHGRCGLFLDSIGAYVEEIKVNLP